MRFAFDADQEEFRRTLRQFFTRELPHAGLPELVASGRPVEPLWRTMAQDLGLQGLTVPEDLGGGGYGPVELALVMEEVGYALLPGPFFATVALATPALLEAGGATSERHLGRIASGDATATIAWTGREAPAIRAETSGDRTELTGSDERVLSGAEADLLFVIADGPDGPSLFEVPVDGAGVAREPVVAFDPTRPIGRVELRGAAAELVGPPGQGAELLERAARRTGLALSAEQVGGAQRCLDLSVEYAKDRHAFGRPIGSFQAIKHQCADLFVEIECARSAVWYAAWTGAEGRAEHAKALPIARAYASETYLRAARLCVHVLGGVGFTVEHPAHLHFRRATSSSQLLGSTARHRDHLIEVLESA
jgi:alkylation response protein AidB-like acyl-CoA dehydrogenase